MFNIYDSKDPSFEYPLDIYVKYEYKKTGHLIHFEIPESFVMPYEENEERNLQIELVESIEGEVTQKILPILDFGIGGKSYLDFLMCKFIDDEKKLQIQTIKMLNSSKLSFELCKFSERK